MQYWEAFKMNWEQKYGQYFILLFLMLAAYLPVLQIGYLYHDDYYILAVNGIKTCSNHPQYISFTQELLRPVGIYFYSFLRYFFDSAVNAWAARTVLFLIAYAVAILFFYRISKVVKQNSWLPTLLTVAIMTLPSHQISVGWIAVSTNLLSELFGLMSAEVILYQSNQEKSQKIKLWRWHGRYLVAMLLFLIGLLTYPGGAFLYFLPVIFTLMVTEFTSIRSFLNRGISLSMPAVMAMGVFFALVKLTQVPSGRGALVGDIGAKINWFWNDLCVTLFKFWFPWINTDLRVIIVAIILIAGVLSIIFPKKDSSRHVLVAKGISLFAGIIVGMAPFLFLAESRSSFHIMVFGQSYLVLLFFFSIQKILTVLHHFLSDFLSKILKNYAWIIPSPSKVCFGLFLIITISSTVASHQNLETNLAIPNVVETAYIKKRISVLDPNKPAHIHFVRPAIQSPMAEWSYSDEFGHPTSIYPQDVPFLMISVTRALKIYPNWKITTGNSRGKYDFPGLDWPPKTEASVPSGAYVIDLNEMPLKMVWH